MFTVVHGGDRTTSQTEKLQNLRSKVGPLYHRHGEASRELNRFQTEYIGPPLLVSMILHRFSRVGKPNFRGSRQLVPGRLTASRVRDRSPALRWVRAEGRSPTQRRNNGSSTDPQPAGHRDEIARVLSARVVRPSPALRRNKGPSTDAQPALASSAAAGGADGAPARAQLASTGGVIGDRTRCDL